MTTDAAFIEITPDDPSDVIVGETVLGFVSRVAPTESREKLQQDAVEILSNSRVNREVKSSPTSLVVGMVQSGKTLSYEALLALARDNSFPLLVVVTGISNALLDQGVGRLKKDLTAARAQGWNFLVNPDTTGNSSQLLGEVLADWRDPDTPAILRKTVVAVVLKNHDRLRGFRNLVAQLDWSGLPVLIVDDEADQASPNNRVRRGEVSTTYRLLVELRDAFPHHAYIQYTATPQAPLLIQLADVLSPEYVKVLTPGDGYSGGDTFFRARRDLLKVIPAGDLLDETALPSDPPESLLDAMRIFFLGLAFSLATEDIDEPRSMLVHPSRGTSLHGHFVGWVTAASRRWLEVLEDPDRDPQEYLDLVDEFRDAHGELSRTVTNFPSLEDLVRFLKYAIRKTQFIEMNTRDGQPVPRVDWDESRGYVLIGGQALDRGFTLRGLTVTYMPRGVGVGNADTIQQRARFFGYKESYIDLCRVYLDPDVLEAFSNYVDHETDMHARLIEFAATGRPLSEWTRAFLLDTSLRPTRQAVIDSRFLHDDLRDEWSVSLAPALSGEDVAANNNSLNQYLEQLSFTELAGHPEKTEAQTHLIADATIQQVFDLLNSQLVADPGSSMDRTGLLLQLAEWVGRNPADECAIVLMRPGQPELRSLEPDDATIRNLFQGESVARGSFRRGEVYPGDRKVRVEGKITVQVHRITVQTSTSTISGVPVLATWVPEQYGLGWYVQQ